VQDAYDKQLHNALDGELDSWLIGSQWAGIWTSGSGQVVANLSAFLNKLVKETDENTDPDTVIGEYKAKLRSEVDSIITAAKSALDSMQVDARNQVRAYYAALWLWNRLEKERWKAAKIGMRTSQRGNLGLEVDHIVSWHTWSAKYSTEDNGKVHTKEELPSVEEEHSLTAENDLSLSDGNVLGNCLLLEKDFNISKSKNSLSDFLGRVHEFSSGKWTVTDWCKAMSIENEMADPKNTDGTELQRLFGMRSAKIKEDLKSFLDRKISRVDLNVDEVPSSADSPSM
jgi:hypothetical protein